MSQNWMMRRMVKVATNATLPVFLVAASAALPALAGTTLVDGVLTFDTSDGDILYTDPIGADVTKIVKTGAGLAHVETGNHITNAFSGTIEVQAGTLWAPYLSNLGKMSALDVSAGATLDVSGYPTGSTSLAGGDVGQFRGAVVTIAGEGVDGVGAICLTNGPWSSTGNLGDYMFKNVNLSADAKVNASYRTGFSSGTLNLNGHTLTVAAGSSDWNRQFFLINETVNPNGGAGEYGHIKLVSGKMTLEQQPVFNGDANNQFIVDGPTAHLQFNGLNAAHAPPWTLVWKSGKLFGTSYAINDPYTSGHWGGPITSFNSAPITNAIGGVKQAMTWHGPATNVVVVRTSGLLTLSNATEITKFKHADVSQYAKATRFYGTGQNWTFDGLGITGGYLDFRNPGGTMTINGNTACYWAMGSGYNPCRQTVVQFREGTYSFRKLDFGFRQGAATHDQLLVRDGGDVTFDYIMNGYTSGPDTDEIKPNNAGGTNVITVTGTGSKLTMRSYMYNEHNGKGTVILNVTDGAVYTSPITSNYLSKERGIFQRFFINVDGATMALTGKDGYAKGGKGTTNYWVMAFTVMEHGATFDTSGASGAKYLQGPIVHPRPGRRVKSIPLPTDSAFTKARHYIPSSVIIKGGSGEGASGFLIVNESTTYATNVLLTSSGFGYGPNDQPTATFFTNANRSVTFTSNCVMEDEPPASAYVGIVKTGAQDLVLQAENTYYGPTTVAEGRLLFEVANGRPIDSSVNVLEGATVNFYGHAQQIPNLGGCGTVANGAVTVTNALVVAYEDLVAGKSLSLANGLTFAAGAAVNLTGTFTQDELKEALSAEKLAVTATGGITGTPTVRVNGAPNPYRPLILVPSSDGKSLSLQYANGTIVIIR